MLKSVTGYLDAAAGLPLHPVARQAFEVAVEDGWADPSRLYGFGRRSAVLLDAARETIAGELSVHPDEVSFLPSGVAALHAAVLGALSGRRRAGNRLVHSAVEHSAIFKAADWHVSLGGEVHLVGVDRLARVDPEEFIAATSQPGVAAAALQAANHEVGTRQPIERVGLGLAERGIPLIVDATHDLPYGAAPQLAPIFTADARMWGGPAGVGILVVRRGTRWSTPFPVDESESGRTAGVVNVAAAVAAAASLRAFRQDRQVEAARLSAMIDHIRSHVTAALPDSEVLGDPDDRLPHLVTFSCLYVDGQTLLSRLDQQGFAVSSGSSCTADTLTPSHVLVAMGALTSGNVRVSLHPGTTEDEVTRFLEVIGPVVADARAQAPRSPASPDAQRSLPTDVGVLAAEGPAALVIDSRGRMCPLPVLDLARAIGGIDVGEQLVVLADDPAAESDIAAWCRMCGQELTETTEYGAGGTAYRVRRIT